MRYLMILVFFYCSPMWAIHYYLDFDAVTAFKPLRVENTADLRFSLKHKHAFRTPGAHRTEAWQAIAKEIDNFYKPENRQEKFFLQESLSTSEIQTLSTFMQSEPYMDLNEVLTLYSQTLEVLAKGVIIRKLWEPKVVRFGSVSQVSNQSIYWLLHQDGKNLVARELYDWIARNPATFAIGLSQFCCPQG